MSKQIKEKLNEVDQLGKLIIIYSILIESHCSLLINLLSVVLSK